MLKRSVTLLRSWSSDFMELRLLSEHHFRGGKGGNLATKRQALGCPRSMLAPDPSSSNPSPPIPSISTQISHVNNGAGTLLFHKNFLLHFRRRRLGNLLRRNDEFGGTFIADEIVQDWSGRLGEGFVVVVEKTCSAGGGGGIVVMVEGRVSWSFRGNRDFETMGGGRGSFRTRDWVMRGSWNIHLGPRSLWRRVETGELHILSASRKPTDRNHLEDRRELSRGNRKGRDVQVS